MCHLLWKVVLSCRAPFASKEAQMIVTEVTAIVSSLFGEVDTVCQQFFANFISGSITDHFQNKPKTKWICFVLLVELTACIKPGSVSGFAKKIYACNDQHLWVLGIDLFLLYSTHSLAWFLAYPSMMAKNKSPYLFKCPQPPKSLLKLNWTYFISAY